jgi:hypothetical protein
MSDDPARHAATLASQAPGEAPEHPLLYVPGRQAAHAYTTDSQDGPPERWEIGLKSNLARFIAGLSVILVCIARATNTLPLRYRAAGIAELTSDAHCTVDACRDINVVERLIGAAITIDATASGVEPTSHPDLANWAR